MSEPGTRWSQYIDSVSKLVAAGAIVMAAWVAQRFESRSTSLSLLNQREQSETQLRASMFQNLIEPIVGSKGGTDTAADREQLLVELLTLNFHDHFEFKPLLVQVDERLAAKQLDDNRLELAAIARRVIDRQINMLTAARPEREGAQASVSTFYFSPDSARAFQVRSPDGEWQVSLTAWKIDPDRRTVSIGVTWSSQRDDAIERHGLDYELTQFDFPLTDYVQLDDLHRFAISLFELDQDSGVIKVIWFPLGYITERERPFDSRAARNLAGEREQ